MAATSPQLSFRNNFLIHNNFHPSKSDLFGTLQSLRGNKFANLTACQCSEYTYCKKGLQRKLMALPDGGDSFWEKAPTPILDIVDMPIHLKNLSEKELIQLADEIRSEISFIVATHMHIKASLASIELTIAIHYVFNSPMDKILWDIGEQSYAHKILTGRRSLMHTLKQKKGLSGFTSRAESKFDAFGAAHGCNSVSAGLGMAVARDIGGKRNHVVTIISNWTTMAGQVYEAMANAGFLDSNMIVILNDSHHSSHPKPEQGPKMKINALPGIISKLHSSKTFLRLREAAEGLTNRIGKRMNELVAEIDEYARGMIGPLGATLFEELGLYYIGPVDGQNINDLICVLSEVASLNPIGPVLIHVITNEEKEPQDMSKGSQITLEQQGISDNFPLASHSDHVVSGISRTFDSCLAEALVAEAERDKNIVVVHAGMGLDPSLKLFISRFPERFFDVGMAEQHAVTFAAGMACGGLKPFCIIESTFLQRAYDQVVQDVDRQSIPVRFAITSAGLVGPDGPTKCGAFDIAFMACLPNMIVMAPSDEYELVNMVGTAACINNKPVCFRYPRGVIISHSDPLQFSAPLELGKGEIVCEGRDVALLGYGMMVQHCLKAQSLLASFGIQVTVANARFCKPLDIELVRMLCKEHKFLVTVEEGTIGGFGSHVSQFIALDGLLDGRIKWRPIVLPDNYIEQASPEEQLEMAGLTAHHIAATTLNLLGRHREALLLMR